MIAIEKCVRLSIRDALNRTSRKPFAWGGVAGYAQLEAIAQTQKCLPLEPETAALRQWLPQVERALEKNHRLAQDVREAQSWLRRIAECLRYGAAAVVPPDRVVSSAQIRQEMDALFAQFRPNPKQAPAQAALQCAWLHLWAAWSEDLVTCYDVPGLPADNLRLEAFRAAHASMNVASAGAAQLAHWVAWANIRSCFWPKVSTIC